MTAASAAGERVEVVDLDGRVTDIVTRAEIRARQLRHRTVFIAVLDSSGSRLLVHHRADWKDIWPSRWDLAFGGICGVGEPWAEAARRELAEEAGLDAPVTAVGPSLAGTPVPYENDDVAELAMVYLVRTDDPPTCPDGEVAETAWVDLGSLTGWLEGRELCPDSVALVLPHLPSP